MAAKPDFKAATAFLGQWCPDGPWNLTAIVPDGVLLSERFTDLKKVTPWLKKYVNDRNIYFQVNPLIDGRNAKSKATKIEVESMGWLWVDMDPRKGKVDPDAPLKDREEIINKETIRARKMLDEFSPPPNVIISSGTGVQGFWRLEPDDQLEIRGSLERAESLEAYNQQLEVILNADNCHNCDRIMRLPGTLNHQNETKRKKYGTREPTLAKLLNFDTDSYSIKSFTQAVKKQDANNSPGGGGQRVTFSGNVESVDLDTLPDSVTDRTKMLCLQGHDPDDPTKWKSRSDLVWHVACQLIREDCPDELIYAILLDPGLGISGHILDQQDPQRAAERAINNGHDAAIDPDLFQLNQAHGVIEDIGGKCRIISEQHDAILGRHTITLQTFADFKNRYGNLSKTWINGSGNPKTAPMGAWWCAHPRRRQYKAMTFAPGIEAADSTYNLWRGFAVKPVAGDRHNPFLKHILENLCLGNSRVYDYIIGWMARTVQTPARAGEAAIVLRGKKGTGKSFFAKTFGHLFGAHYIQIADAKHLTGNFNAHLRDALVVFGDEAFFAGDKKHEGVLKMLITENQLFVEPKGVDAMAVPNFTHIIMASNSEWVVPAGADERRFLVLDVSDHRMKDVEYFKNLGDQMDKGGYGHLLHFLKNYDLSNFEVRLVPSTEGLVNQKLRSLGPFEQWWFTKLEQGKLLEGVDGGWTGKTHSTSLYQDYVRVLRDIGVPRKLTEPLWGRGFKNVVPGWDDPEKYSKRMVRRTMDRPVHDEHGVVVRSVSERGYFYQFPSLAECRNHWEDLYGKHEWPLDDLPEDEVQQDLHGPPVEAEPPF